MIDLWVFFYVNLIDSPKRKSREMCCQIQDPASLIQSNAGGPGRIEPNLHETCIKRYERLAEDMYVTSLSSGDIKGYIMYQPKRQGICYELRLVRSGDVRRLTPI